MRKPGALALVVPLALAGSAGCGTTDDKPGGVPSAGTSTSAEAADALERVSSDLYDLIGVKGKASDSRAGVTECSDKDPEKYFRVFHPWTFYPASAAELGRAMEQLKEELPKHGWKVVSYGPDTSRNKNMNLVADNDAKKASVKVVEMAKNDPPKLSLTVVSGCYKTPNGTKVEEF
ncbi:hypothetical protein ACH4C6_04460 [Streptomyces sp. NPDC017943]|uniref:hypothetical protein n=1 Tax=Streptomyces sp. NPDC017943 TaxID=3365019 RepID=UPI0037BCDB9A